MRKISLLALVLVLLCADRVYAQGPWGHAPKHGYGMVDVVQHVLNSDLQFHRHSDGSYMLLSKYTPNGYWRTVSFHNADGTLRTAYPLRNWRKANSCLFNNCAKSGYHLAQVPLKVRMQWVANGVVRATSAVVFNTTPPTIPLFPGWMALCDWRVETVDTCRRRVLATSRG